SHRNADIATLSLHDALPISWRTPGRGDRPHNGSGAVRDVGRTTHARPEACGVLKRRSLYETDAKVARTHDRPAAFSPGETTEGRSEEHTSELQSRVDLVCRL